MNWFKQSTFNFPSEFKSSPNSSQVAFKPFAQFSYAGSDSSDSVNYIAPRVPSLLLSSSPDAIRFTIAESVVHPLKSQSVRTFTHVCEEILERKPTFADFNSSVAVIFGIRFPFTAPVLHVKPHVVDSAFRASMLSDSFACQFSVKTATGFCVTRPEVSICNNDLLATVAQANTFTGTSIGISNYKKSCESLVNEVYSGRHNVRVSISNVLFSNRHWL